MDLAAARKLATRVAKESDDVRVKFGETNGKVCLHLIVVGGRRYSNTIFTEAEWSDHPENKYNRPRRREVSEQVDEAIISAVANKEAI